jgi:hypothetical protein
VLAVAVAFVAGIGLGESLRDRSPHGTQTLIRTLQPFSLPPVAQDTVTVTTAAP